MDWMSFKNGSLGKENPLSIPYRFGLVTIIMNNFSKFFEEVVKTSMRMQEAHEHGDRDIVAYYNGKLDAYRFILTNDMLDTKK